MRPWLLLVAAAVAGLCLLGCSHLPMVRECGATVGSHGDSASFDWVQPCSRRDGVSGVDDDLGGCSEKCRRAKDECEAAMAEARGARNTARDFQRIDAVIMAECRAAPERCTSRDGWYIPCPGAKR